MEKFIDQTEIGEIHESMCNDANPAAIPAIARSNGIPAAIMAPKAMNSITRVGNPLTSSALCRASSFILLKSAHTGHSPVTSAVAEPANSISPTYVPSSPANSGRCASSSIFCSTGISAVFPSREINPASAGIFSGSAKETTSGPADSLSIND